MAHRILIIDDEENIRRMMRLTLEAAGYEVAEASDGAEGLRRFADGSTWAAVILDQRMPGLDGLDTLRALKQQDKSARVIMATAYASIELAVDAMKLGATDFVRKPMTPEVLRNALTAALNKTSPQPRAAAEITTESVTAPVPLIQTITMNGFTIIDDHETPIIEPEQRRFVVASPDGGRHHVLVQIDAEATALVERMTGRRLPAEDSFWTSRARRLLTDYLWNEGKVPPTRRLVLKDLDPDQVVLAGRWRSTTAK